MMRRLCDEMKISVLSTGIADVSVTIPMRVRGPTGGGPVGRCAPTHGAAIMAIGNRVQVRHHFDKPVTSLAIEHEAHASPGTRLHTTIVPHCVVLPSQNSGGVVDAP